MEQTSTLKKTRNCILWGLALTSMALGRVAWADGSEVGDVIVHNKTDQFVQLRLEGWKDQEDRFQARSGTYEFAPGERSRLAHDGATIRAADLRYTLVTAAGATPADSDKVWTNRYSSRSGYVAVDITDELLAPRRESRTEVRKAWALIESQATTILGVAHPSATLLALEYEGVSGVQAGEVVRKGHFALTYTYRWKSAFENWTRIECFFDANGKLYLLQPARSAPGDTSSLMSPFAFSNALVDWLEEKILACEQVKNEPLARQMLEAVANQNDARLLLQTWLQIQQL